MSTIINTPNGSDNDSGTGFIIGIVVILVLIILFFVYGMPGRDENPDVINVNVPAEQNEADNNDGNPITNVFNTNSTTTVNSTTTQR